jgi:hypothetical protein
LSNNLAEGVDNLAVVQQFGRGCGGDQLVKEPEIFAGSRDVVVDADELKIADPVVNSGPGFPVAELTSGGESEVGTLLANAEPGSFFFAVEASNLLPDAGIDGATSDQSAIGEEEDSEDEEESQKFGDLSCPSVEPFYFALPPSESFSKRGREVSRHDVAFMRGKPRLMALW